jgi:hypothetical protein
MSVGGCRIRLFVIKEEPYSDYSDGFEVLKHEVFETELLSTPTPPKPETSDGLWYYTAAEIEKQEENRLTNKEWVEENIGCIGFDGIKEDILDVLEHYGVDDVVEIIADYIIEGWWSDSYDGREWDEEHRLDNVQHNKLRDKEIKRFIGDFKRGEDGLIQFLHEDSSLNHGIPEYLEEEKKSEQKV